MPESRWLRERSKCILTDRNRRLSLTSSKQRLETINRQVAHDPEAGNDRRRPLTGNSEAIHLPIGAAIRNWRGEPFRQRPSAHEEGGRQPAAWCTARAKLFGRLARGDEAPAGHC
jgi:hypothetical protein